MTTIIEDTAERLSPAQRAVTEHLRLTAAGNVDEWLDLFTVDGVLEFPFAPTGVPARLQGRDALAAHMSHFPENFDVEFVGLEFHETTDPGRIVAEFRSVGTAVPTGKPYEQVCISVVYVNDAGLITRYVDYWNPLIAIEALTPDADIASADLAGNFGG
ncbi:MAG: putative isomerase [Microbacterium sp.]|jgi:ketosteroid isomerase-like protein|uniref:nuclear transport factor 2 family protein n=1 Tax=Microbacterium sp. TaxID=51671 RepID=UPI0026230842|nr:nuclear transport factor 2 family protein [Microbacterium sp.]MDF2560357.1 putative isomerase [Microbacterium sp.]